MVKEVEYICRRTARRYRRSGHLCNSIETHIRKEDRRLLLVGSVLNPLRLSEGRHYHLSSRVRTKQLDVSQVLLVIFAGSHSRDLPLETAIARHDEALLMVRTRQGF